MKLGENILKLRKDNNLSQEKLAEKVAVTRQTISNWELSETSPNPNQLKQLSKVLNVSIDELLDNDVRGVLVEKVSNTEKLSGIIIKILKFIGIAFIVMLVIDVVALIFFTMVRKEHSVSNAESVTMNCHINEDDFHISIGSDGYFNCSNCNKQMQTYLYDVIDRENLEHSVEKIEKYFSDNNGSCE